MQFAQRENKKLDNKNSREPFDARLSFATLFDFAIPFDSPLDPLDLPFQTPCSLSCSAHIHRNRAGGRINNAIVSFCKPEYEPSRNFLLGREFSQKLLLTDCDDPKNLECTPVERMERFLSARLDADPIRRFLSSSTCCVFNEPIYFGALLNLLILSIELFQKRSKSQTQRNLLCVHNVNFTW